MTVIEINAITVAAAGGDELARRSTFWFSEIVPTIAVGGGR